MFFTLIHLRERDLSRSPETLGELSKWGSSGNRLRVGRVILTTAPPHYLPLSEQLMKGGSEMEPKEGLMEEEEAAWK